LNTKKGKTFNWSASRNEGHLETEPAVEDFVPEEIEEYGEIIDSMDSDSSEEDSSR
jgi:hypothetical protein